MIKPSVTDMLSGKESRYPLVMAVAKRAREIVAEKELKGEIIEKKPVLLAIEDFKAGKYTILEPEKNN